VLAQYAALIELGLVPSDRLDTLKSLGSPLQGHPDMKLFPGIEANTGALGQGLSLANGIALRPDWIVKNSTPMSSSATANSVKGKIGRQ
jgi:transketolase N-terminal domain/subunit